MIKMMILRCLRVKPLHPCAISCNLKPPVASKSLTVWSVGQRIEFRHGFSPKKTTPSIELVPDWSLQEWGGFHKWWYPKMDRLYWFINVYNGTSHWNGWFGATPIDGNLHMSGHFMGVCWYPMFFHIVDRWNESRARLSSPGYSGLGSYKWVSPT